MLTTQEFSTHELYDSAVQHIGTHLCSADSDLNPRGLSVVSCPLGCDRHSK